MPQTAYTLWLAGISIELEYRNVKTMRLTVYPPDGRACITAPSGTNPELIKNFAISKIDWIKIQQEKFKKKAGVKTGKTGPLRNNSPVYIWGKEYKLELVEKPGNSKIVIENGYVRIYTRPNSTKAQKQEILDRWYKNSLKKAAPALIQKWELHLGIKVQKLYVQKMKTIWGSCNYLKHTMRLNSELAKRSPEFLEYVIVHEMLHVIEKGHNKNYYRLLNKYIPDWKIIRKKLNSGEQLTSSS